MYQSSWLKRLSNNLSKWDSVYPKTTGLVGGLAVRDDIPNTSSVGASLYNYTILPGVREVQMSYFDGPKSVFYAADDFRRSRMLAKQIKETRQINPLIIAVEDEGPYILEGSHRYVALHELGVKSFPAMVVIDESDWTQETDQISETKTSSKKKALDGWMTVEGEDYCPKCFHELCTKIQDLLMLCKQCQLLLC